MTHTHALVCLCQEDERTFITFHDNKPMEGIVTEKWDEFNVKVNTTIPHVLQWVSKCWCVVVSHGCWLSPQGSTKADPLKGPYLYYTQDLATMTCVNTQTHEIVHIHAHTHTHTLSSQFPEVIGYIQPIKELILSEENVQVQFYSAPPTQPHPPTTPLYR